MRKARLPPTPTNVRHEITTNNNTYTTLQDESVKVFGPDLAVATSQVLDSLSDHERQIIMNVLNRDEGVRQTEATRIM
jgi:hypothetical protein